MHEAASKAVKGKQVCARQVNSGGSQLVPVTQPPRHEVQSDPTGRVPSVHGGTAAKSTDSGRESRVQPKGVSSLWRQQGCPRSIAQTPNGIAAAQLPWYTPAALHMVHRPTGP